MTNSVALTIAGSDSSGGAGVQADLKAFSTINVHGTAVITNITAQNTKQVTGVLPVKKDMIELQLQTLLKDLPIAAAKTGMLYTEDIIETIAKQFKKSTIPLVVDPVLISTTGGALADLSFISAITQRLLPYSTVIAPNMYEAEQLTGLEILSVQDMHEACLQLHKTGCQYCVVTGGHGKGKLAVDVLYDGSTFYELSLPSHPRKKAHGSGCTFSALITGFLAQGYDPVHAVTKAKYLVWSMIREGYRISSGVDILQSHPCHFIPETIHKLEDVHIWMKVADAVDNLLDFLPASLVAEVGMNIGFARKNAKDFRDVCALDGRIVKTKKKIHKSGQLCFGGSKHVANIVLAAMSKEPAIRSAANLRFSKQLVQACEKAQFSIGKFDRTDEPKKSVSTMEWGTVYAFEHSQKTPDVIYDNGGIGKEPMVRVLGTDPSVVISKIHTILSFLKPLGEN